MAPRRGTRSRTVRLLLPLVALLAALPLLSLDASAQEPVVFQLDLDGQITRATLEHFTEVVEAAEEANADAILLRLDTPGGGLAETEEIVKAMLRTDLPFIGYVHPVGASSLSAGTMILMATDVAAMAPGTTIGSLQPVIVGPGGFEPVEDDKIINALVEQVKESLVLHGRNESLADAFIRENVNLNASDALAVDAIEFVAEDRAALLAAVDGFTTHFKGIQLELAGADVLLQEPSFRLRAILIITDPVIASILLLLGIYGIIFGISTPGQGAEVFGTIAIALGLVGLGFAINLVALFLIVLGVALLIVEIATPSFGVIGTGGIIALVLGTIFLAPISPPTVLITPEQQLLILLILLVPTAGVGAFLLFALYKVLEARRQTPFHDRMIGSRVEVVEPVGPDRKGFVRFEGELWRAVADEDIPEEERVYIVARDGPQVTVSRQPPEPPETEGQRPLMRLSAAFQKLWKR